ncbi:hypothetical protein D3C75_1299560 [compost metagenome]
MVVIDRPVQLFAFRAAVPVLCREGRVDGILHGQHEGAAGCKAVMDLAANLVEMFNVMQGE